MAFRIPKGHFLQAKRPSFGFQKTAFYNVLNIKEIFKGKKVKK